MYELNMNLVRFILLTVPLLFEKKMLNYAVGHTHKERIYIMNMNNVNVTLNNY